jgi:hypothetical protein
MLIAAGGFLLNGKRHYTTKTTTEEKTVHLVVKNVSKRED